MVNIKDNRQLDTQILAEQDQSVDVVEIKELMGHSSIVTTMRYIHATDQGRRGAITVLSEYRHQRRRKDGHKWVTKKKRQALRPTASH